MSAVTHIEQDQLAINTCTIAVKAITVNNKKMTLSVFRQLPEVNPWVNDWPPRLADNIQPWGFVRYDFASYTGGVHILFTYQGELCRWHLPGGHERKQVLVKAMPDKAGRNYLREGTDETEARRRKRQHLYDLYVGCKDSLSGKRGKYPKQAALCGAWERKASIVDYPPYKAADRLEWKEAREVRKRVRDSEEAAEWVAAKQVVRQSLATHQHNRLARIIHRLDAETKADAERCINEFTAGTDEGMRFLLEGRGQIFIAV